MNSSVETFSNSIEIRCQCSRLLFKRLSKALEVKCPRCKRIHTFTLAQITAFLQAGNFCAIHQQSSEARDPESNAQQTRKEEK